MLHALHACIQPPEATQRDKVQTDSEGQWEGKGKGKGHWGPQPEVGETVSTRAREIES
jgi:hypothetical protein